MGFEFGDLVVASVFNLGQAHRALYTRAHGFGIAGIGILPFGIDVLGLVVVQSDSDSHTVPIRRGWHNSGVRRHALTGRKNS